LGVTLLGVFFGKKGRDERDIVFGIVLSEVLLLPIQHLDDNPDPGVVADFFPHEFPPSLSIGWIDAACAAAL
jgi:hypothetical protein